MNPSDGSSPLGAGLIFLAITALVVIRFAFRELRLRTVRAVVIWLRAGFMLFVLAALLILTVSTDPADNLKTIVAVFAGGLIGVLAGIGIAGNTTFQPAAMRGAVRAQGNYVTLGIWVLALLLRVAARFAYPPGSQPLTQLPLNCGTVALVAVAFTVIAAAFQREIIRLQPN